jgi:predicted RNase H-like nuclease (RuvC/YqgF family)
MDELGLTVEGIINKTQKLILRNKQLREKIVRLEADQQGLSEKLIEQSSRISELEARLSNIQLSYALGKEDSNQARQKVNDLLREIEKCYALLNR